MKKAFSIFSAIVIFCMLGAVFYKYKSNELEKESPDVSITPVNAETDINTLLISQFEKNNSNELISPLSITYALKMLNEGASGITKTQIDSLLTIEELPDMVSIENIVGMANSIFVRNDYKTKIKDEYINNLSSKYNAEVKFDSFANANSVNSWVKEKTFGMIDNLIKSIDENTVLILMNALAIDLEWKSKFSCISNSEQDFVKSDGAIVKTTMMHDSEGQDLIYIENENAKGIVKPYKKYDMITGKEVIDESDNTIEFEYVAILPNTNANNYLSKLSLSELNDLLSKKTYSSDTVKINLGLPKYSYDYEFELKKALIRLGMTDAFDENKADFSNIIKNSIEDSLYVSDAIHKTHIDLNENGTKAAAVTAFMMDRASSIEKEKRIIDITFNKPFVYVIREKKTNKIWFIGIVNEPSKWDDNKDCQTKYGF